METNDAFKHDLSRGKRRIRDYSLPRSNQRWTAEEDREVIKCVLFAAKERLPLLDAFRAAGRNVGRTPGAVKFRWETALKQGCHEFGALVSAGNTKFLHQKGGSRRNA